MLIDQRGLKLPPAVLQRQPHKVLIEWPQRKRNTCSSLLLLLERQNVLLQKGPRRRRAHQLLGEVVHKGAVQAKQLLIDVPQVADVEDLRQEEDVLQAVLKGAAVVGDARQEAAAVLHPHVVVRHKVVLCQALKRQPFKGQQLPPVVIHLGHRRGVPREENVDHQRVDVLQRQLNGEIARKVGKGEHHRAQVGQLFDVGSRKVLLKKGEHPHAQRWLHLEDAQEERLPVVHRRRHPLLNLPNGGQRPVGGQLGVQRIDRHRRLIGKVPHDLIVRVARTSVFRSS